MIQHRPIRRRQFHNVKPLTNQGNPPLPITTQLHAAIPTDTRLRTTLIARLLRATVDIRATSPRVHLARRPHPLDHPSTTDTKPRTTTGARQRTTTSPRLGTATSTRPRATTAIRATSPRAHLARRPHPLDHPSTTDTKPRTTTGARHRTTTPTCPQRAASTTSTRPRAATLTGPGLGTATSIRRRVTADIRATSPRVHLTRRPHPLDHPSTTDTKPRTTTGARHRATTFTSPRLGAATSTCPRLGATSICPWSGAGVADIRLAKYQPWAVAVIALAAHRSSG
ncbi:hypothetical protein [Kribbella sp. NPDC051620]|uniref:hypothetical protein n=1 Tax=Kribbella sp. NPDC051620 TaxID=3364120 RepID=UPI0037A47A1C